MRRIMIVLVAIPILIGLSGCGKSKEDVSGTYISKDNQDEYLKLRADGTFHRHAGISFFSYDGTWNISGNEITLSCVFGGPDKAKLKGNKIIEENGKVWIKEKE